MLRRSKTTTSSEASEANEARGQSLEDSRTASEARKRTWFQSEYAITWLFLLVGIGLLVYGLHKHGVIDPPPELRFGEHLDATQVVGDEGETLNLSPRHWTLVLSGPPEDLELAQYLSFLMGENREETASLEPIVLIDEGPEKLNEFEWRNFLLFPLHALDTFRHEDLVGLGLRGHQRAYALISPDLDVVFGSTYLKPNDLRLLLEKHLRISPAGESKTLEPGEAFPTLQLSQVAGPSSEPTSDSSRRTWIVFTSQCVSCSLGNQVKALADDQALLRDYFREKGEVLGVIFSNSFDEAELIDRLEYVGLEAIPAYRSAGPIPGLEDPYLRSSLQGEDVVVAELSDDGEVRQIEGLWRTLHMAKTTRSQTEGVEDE